MRTFTMLFITGMCLLLGLVLAFTLENYINSQYPSCAWCDERHGTTKIAWGLGAHDLANLISILPIASVVIVTFLLFLKDIPKEKGGF